MESLDDSEALIGTVTKVESLALPPGKPLVEVIIKKLAQEEDNDSGEIKYYGIKITTTAGRCTIDFRNSSNGYYGGYMEVVGED